MEICQLARILTLLFANDQILLTKSESYLKRSMHNLNNMVEFSTEINTEKQKLRLLEERNLSKERYASTPGYCNELITLNVLNLMKERI